MATLYYKIQNCKCTIIQFNSIHAFISDKSPYYTGYINYNEISRTLTLSLSWNRDISKKSNTRFVLKSLQSMLNDNAFCILFVVNDNAKSYVFSICICILYIY